MTFLDLVDAARSTERGITFLGPEPERVSWQEMWDDASRVAAVLQHHGLKSGSRIAMLGNTSRPLVTAIEACWLMGATVIVLPIPPRMPSIDAFIDTCRRMMSRGDADALLVDAELAGFFGVSPPASVVLTLSELDVQARTTEVRWEPGFGDVERDAILQFTSGSTSEPKAVRVSYDVLESNSSDINRGLALDPDHDVAISWLPLYHDMGLIGMLATVMSRSITLVLASPQDFMTRPTMWFETVARYRGTLTAGPNFAYALAARALAGRDDPLDLSTLRVAINGAEPVRPDTMRMFVDAGAAHGLDPGCVVPAYGLAECGIAGCFPPPGRGLVTEWVEADTLAPGARVVVAPEGPTTREQVLCGGTVPGVDARIVDVATRERLPARHVGELMLSGRGVSAGYHEHPEANSERYHHGWLATGDLAYLTDSGEAVICGRIKDLIIVGGVNHYPQDIEHAALAVEGVRPGNVVAVGVEGADTEYLVVVAESTGEPTRQLGRAVRRAVADACGITPRHVVICAKGSLPKTSSGKLQRAATRERYLAGAFDVVVGAGRVGG